MWIDGVTLFVDSGRGSTGFTGDFEIFLPPVLFSG
jgi:hypothetical protein